MTDTAVRPRQPGDDERVRARLRLRGCGCCVLWYSFVFPLRYFWCSFAIIFCVPSAGFSGCFGVMFVIFGVVP